MATRDVESTLLACSEVTDGRSRSEPVRSLAASGSLARVTMFGLRRACGLMATVLAVLFSEAAAQTTRHPHGTPPGGIVWDHLVPGHTDAELGHLSDLWDPIRLTSVVHDRQVVAAEQPGAAAADPPERGRPDRDFYVEPRSVGTRRETEPPRYVRSLDQTGLAERWARSWLDVGLDHRLRFEYRHNDFRRPIPATDWPFLLRTRAYLGVTEIADPLRCAVELEDARRYNSQFPLDDRDVNEYEIIQMFGELHFADALGADRPLRFQAGRLAMEYVDRRLIARNEWRNTTNNFEGFRAILGRQQNDWQLDLLALQPVERFIHRPDRRDSRRWFYGAGEI
jgi:hypothetical protein